MNFLIYFWHFSSHTKKKEKQTSKQSMKIQSSTFCQQQTGHERNDKKYINEEQSQRTKKILQPTTKKIIIIITRIALGNFCQGLHSIALHLDKGSEIKSIESIELRQKY